MMNKLHSLVKTQLGVKVKYYGHTHTHLFHSQHKDMIFLKSRTNNLGQTISRGSPAPTIQIKSTQLLLMFFS